MQRSQQTKSRFTRVCQIGAVLLSVPILMAIGCPLTVTVNCPADGTAGTAATVTVTVSFGQGAATWTTDATNGTVADGAMASPSVTPAAAGTVTVTVTATDEAGDTATDECTFEAAAGPCTEDADCDDGDVCTTDTCTDGTCDNAAVDGCCNSDADCAEGEVCANNACATPCAEDADCDDGDPCNGSETCDADDAAADAAGCVAGTAPDCDDTDDCTTDTCDANDANADPDTGCVNTDVVCDAGQECSGGVCVDTCVSAADCDDGDPCTDDSCVANLCENTDKDCDDGLFCTGTETCNATTGDCESSGDPCDAATETCNDDTDECDPFVICTDDAGCDDNVFCNGAETCNIPTGETEGTCQAGTDPCAADEECDETGNDCIPPMGETRLFTLGVDDLTGTSGNDTFNAFLEFNPPTGTTIPTFGNSDKADGLGGEDVLNATTNFAVATTITATLDNMDILNFTDLGTAATTINGLNFACASTINNINSTNVNALMVTNLAELVANAGLTGTPLGGGGLTLSFTTAATSATDDAINLALSNVLGGTLNITSATTNGAETLNVSSDGPNPNTLLAITQTTGTTLTTMTFSGAQDLTITNAVPNSVTTLNGGSGTIDGDLNVTVGAGSANVAFTGGNGDDTAVYGATYATTDIIDGGLGSNTLSITTVVAAPAVNQTNVTNMQGLTISNAHTTAPVVSRFGAITTVNLPLGSNGGTVTVGDGATVTLGARAANNDSAGALTVTMSPDTNSDDLTLVFNDSDTTGVVTLTTVDTLNLVSNVDLDGSAADGGGVNAFTAAVTMPDLTGTQMLITGTEDVSFLAAVTARVINAATFEHSVLMALNASGQTGNATVATGGASITGGLAPTSDRLVGSTAGDSINTGVGNDVAQPGRGQDTVSFGAGIVTLDLEDLDVANIVAANRVTVTGFQADGTVFNATTGTVDAVRFDNVGTQGDLSDGAVAGEFQSITTPGNVTVAAGISIVELAWEFSPGVILGAGGANELNGTTLLSALGASTGTTAGTITTNANADDVIIIAYQSGNAYIYHANEGADVDAGAVQAGEIALIATFSGGISVGGFDVTQFIN